MLFYFFRNMSFIGMYTEARLLFIVVDVSCLFWNKWAYHNHMKPQENTVICLPLLFFSRGIVCLRMIGYTIDTLNFHEDN